MYSNPKRRTRKRSREIVRSCALPYRAGLRGGYSKPAKRLSGLSRKVEYASAVQGLTTVTC